MEISKANTERLIKKNEELAIELEGEKRFLEAIATRYALVTYYESEREEGWAILERTRIASNWKRHATLCKRNGDFVHAEIAHLSAANIYRQLNHKEACKRQLRQARIADKRIGATLLRKA